MWPDRKIVGAVIRAWVAGCFAFFVANSAAAQCVPPPFQKGQVWQESDSRISMTISVRMADLSPRRVVCLAEALKKQNKTRKDVTVLVFTSIDAAQNYEGDVALGDPEPFPNGKSSGTLDTLTWAKQLHIVYSYNHDKREEYIRIKPLGFSNELEEDTKIDLPAIATPHCRLEIAKRCLLALDTIVYARDAYPLKISGDVTLTGIVTRDGQIASIKVANTSGVPSERIDLFAREAIGNLKSWRLERAPREDAVRITYSYVIDGSLPQRGQTEVKFRLPERVTIRVRPR